MRPIDADALGNRMYHESFEKDSDLQKWDGGCCIRYKLFEQVLRAAPTIDPIYPTPSNTLGALDCVERQAAIDVLNRGLSKIPYVNNTDEEMIRRDERMCCIQEIRELPSVPRKGKWIKDIERFGDNAYHCSQCGAVLEKDDLEWRNNYYCYHCGAKMEDNKDE